MPEPYFPPCARVSVAQRAEETQPTLIKWVMRRESTQRLTLCTRRTTRGSEASKNVIPHRGPGFAVQRRHVSSMPVAYMHPTK